MCLLHRSSVWGDKSRANRTFFFSLSLFGVGIVGEKFFHSNIKVIAPWPRDHNTELWGLTVTEPLGKPLHLRHLAKYSPLAISALQEVTAFFLPCCPRHTISSSFTRKKEKKILLKKQETRRCVIERENSSSCLSSEAMKAKPQTKLCGPPSVLCVCDSI